MENNSEALLTQILLLIQNLHQDITLFEQRVLACEDSIVEVGEKVSKLINEGFVNGDYEAHADWHRHRSMGAFRRWLIKILS